MTIKPNGGVIYLLKVILMLIAICSLIFTFGFNWATTARKSELQALKTKHQLLEQEVKNNYERILEKLDVIEEKIEGGK